MAALDKKTTYKNLKKKGFVETSGDHKYLEFSHGGKIILFTKVSHGSSKDLDDYLIKQMSVQCKLDKIQFLNLARCPLSKDAYIKILQDQNLLD